MCTKHPPNTHCTGHFYIQLVAAGAGVFAWVAGNSDRRQWRWQRRHEREFDKSTSSGGQRRQHGRLSVYASGGQPRARASSRRWVGVGGFSSRASVVDATASRRRPLYVRESCLRKGALHCLRDAGPLRLWWVCGVREFDLARPHAPGRTPATEWRAGTRACVQCAAALRARAPATTCALLGYGPRRSRWVCESVSLSERGPTPRGARRPRSGEQAHARACSVRRHCARALLQRRALSWDTGLGDRADSDHRGGFARV